MKKVNIYSLLLTVIILAASCSKSQLDEVNRNRNNPADMQAKFILTDVLLSTAYEVGGDPSTYVSIYLEQEAGVHNQTYNAEKRIAEPTLATTYNNTWNSLYSHIRSLKIAVQKTSAGGEEEGNDVTGGIAKVLLAYNLALLTDLYGDVPYTQSGIMNEDGTPAYMQPVIDKQSDLYAEVNKLLDEAIVQFDGADNAGTGSIGTQDILFGGNKTKWKKTAYGLKARYLLRKLKISSDVEGDMEQVLEYVGNSYTSVAEEAMLNVYNGSSTKNPLHEYTYSRDGLGVSKSLATKFKDLDDPRGDQAFMAYTQTNFRAISLDDAIAAAVPNGDPVQQQFVYPLSIVDYALTAPTMLFSYHELLFIKAEALVRLEREAEAEPVLNEALRYAFRNLERSLNATVDSYGFSADIDLSDDVADDYFNNSVKARFAADPLKETVLQKYLAFYGASGEATEAYSDYRRLKALGEANFIDLKNSLTDKFPLRFTYGNSDVTANPNVGSAYGDGNYVYSENVWWAGGSR